MSGWIKIHRKLLNWEWYNDINCRLLFLHCLLMANFEEGKWRGIVIERGSFVSSLANLSQSSGLTIQELRTSLTKLKSTCELTCKPHSEYTVFIVVKYNDYQDSNTPTNIQPTRNQHATNTEATCIKEDKELKKNKEEKEISRVSPDKLSLFLSWLEYRKGIKKQIKSESMAKLVDRFNKEPLEKVKTIVDLSIENGWQGLFWDKFTDLKQQNGNKSNTIESAKQRNIDQAKQRDIDRHIRIYGEPPIEEGISYP